MQFTHKMHSTIKYPWLPKLSDSILNLECSLPSSPNAMLVAASTFESNLPQKSRTKKQGSPLGHAEGPISGDRARALRLFEQVSLM